MTTTTPPVTLRDQAIATLLDIRATAHADLAAMPAAQAGTEWAADRRADIAWCNRQLERLGAGREGANRLASERTTDNSFQEDETMPYELAREVDGAWEHLGDFETAERAYAAALGFGPGDYVGTRDMDGGHYEEEISITEGNNVLVRNAGEHEWSEWDG